MKRCNACGTSLNDDVMHCSNCGGNNFTADVNNQPMGMPQSQPTNQMPNQSMGMHQQQLSQPVGMPQGQPMGQQPMPDYGQQPMGQMPAAVQAVPTGNMPMTYATVYMALLALSTVSSLISLFKDFNFSTLISVAFSGAVVYFLYKRTKVGRILAMVHTIMEAVVGGIVALLGILFFVGFSVLDLSSYGIALGGIVGGVFIALGAVFLAVGICSFIYFKKRACMYVN